MRLLDDLQEGQAYGIGDIDPDVIPLDIRHNSVIWSATVPLISFECIEWHASNRVRRQFGLRQGVPNQERDLGASHEFGDHLQLLNLVFQENLEVPPPPRAPEPARGPAPAPTPPPPPPPKPPQQRGSKLRSVSCLVSWHRGRTTHIQVRTSSNNFGAKMSVDSSRSAEGAGGIIHSGNTRRIPMSLIQESNRVVDDEIDNYLVDHPEGEDEGEDEDDDEDEGEDEDEDDDDAVDEDPAPSASKTNCW
ncbi:uncharacterized protein LOC107464722 [Arachis duranensis]|uniref:Uncharacterized protein LOC107464722 n=1 Tax=Arachis duranensis TaxID=130453 RepID=A0A6P4BAN3_ARADU|nr:uncharacterized protein LOC107464722 [Arachis duranensis]